MHIGRCQVEPFLRRAERLVSFRKNLVRPGTDLKGLLLTNKPNKEFPD